MRIHDKKRGLWFVVVLDDGMDEVEADVEVLSYEDLDSYVGRFRWLDDVKAIFTRKREAEQFAKKVTLPMKTPSEKKKQNIVDSKEVYMGLGFGPRHPEFPR